jgi:hypothetical protein
MTSSGIEPAMFWIFSPTFFVFLSLVRTPLNVYIYVRGLRSPLPLRVALHLSHPELG